MTWHDVGRPTRALQCLGHVAIFRNQLSQSGRLASSARLVRVFSNPRRSGFCILGCFVALTARCWYGIPSDALETTGLLLPKETPLAPASKRAKKGAQVEATEGRPPPVRKTQLLVRRSTIDARTLTETK